MSEEEKFDDLLRSKLMEREFLFDEHNWDKAEQKIERAENQRKFRRIGVIFFSGMAIGVLIMLPFILSKNNTPAQITQQVSSANTNRSNEVVINQPSTNINSPSTNTPTTASSHPISSGSDNSGSQSVSSGNTNKPGRDNASTITNNNTATLPAPVATVAKKQKTNVSSSAPQQYSYVRPAKEKHSRKSTNTNTSSTTPTVASANTTNSGNTPNINQQENTNAGTNNVVANPTNVNNPAAANLDQTQTNNSTSSPTTNNNTTSVKSSIKDSSATTSTTSPDTAANSPDGFINPPPQPKKQSSSLTTFSIDAGGGYSLGWIKDDATQGNGFSPVFGISTTHYFSGTWSAYLGLQFNMLNNVNILYSSNANQYSFGLNTNVNSVTLKTLYYAALPVRVQYCFGFNNLISVGANVLYLINTNSSVVNYNQDYFGVSGYTSANKSGYMDGLNSLDVQAVIAYKRKIYNRLTAGLEFYYGLLNIEDNSFFGDNTFARNSGLKLIFSYDIIK